jgi:hypothetical protein
LFEALDAVVTNRSGFTSGTVDEWQRLWVDPTIQREFLKQDADVEALEKIGPIDAAFLERLRSDSRRIGLMMLREFQTYAQSQLRTGPMRRLWPSEPPAAEDQIDEPDGPDSRR